MRLNLISFISICFPFFSLGLSAQITINGKVEELNGTPIARASVVVYDAGDNVTAYGYSNDAGRFEIILGNVNKNDLILAANSLGFQEQRKTLVINNVYQKYTISFNLIEKAEQLNEVVLQSTQKISANGNVTTLQTKPFTDDTEQTVEDVLRKLPGIEVLDNGSIKAHGKFIDKLLIDGEDMFSNDYQLLSKNLDAKALKAVQILDKFQDNPVLAKILDSDRVALNLEIKDEFKNIWFGNVSGGLGSYERAKVTTNIGLLRKKVKFFYFGDYNNLGDKAADQLEGAPSSLNLTSAYQEKEVEPEIESIYSIDMKENGFFREGQSTFNNAFLNTLGFVTKPAPDIELRGIGSFSNDIQNQLFLASTVYNIGQDPIRFNENSDTRHTNSIASGELELKYTGGERSYLKNLFVYNNRPEHFDNNLLYNQTEISQDLDKTEHSFYNHFNYSYVLAKNRVLHNYVYIGQNKVKQDASIRSPLLNDLLDMGKLSQINDLSNDKLNVYGIESNLFSKFGDLEHRLEVGYELLKEKRINSFTAGPENALVGIDSLENRLNFRQQKLRLTTSLSYLFGEKVKMILGFSLNRLSINIGSNLENDWLFNPEITLDLKRMKLGRFVLSYEKTFSVPESVFFLQNYQLTTYRSFIRGTDENHLLRRNLYNFRYKWANELESQALTLSFKYDAVDKSYSTSNEINQNFTFSSYQLTDGRDRISANLDFTSYFEDLNLSTNLRTTQNWSTVPLLANSEEFGKLNNYSSSYLFSGTTYFDMPVNFAFEINSNHSQSKFNNVLSKTHWENASLDLTYKLSDDWHISLNNDLYDTPGNTYYFLGAKVDYQPKDSDLSFRLVMNNLTNEDRFSNTVINEYTTYNSSIRLIPRYVILSAKYRF